MVKTTLSVLFAVIFIVSAAQASEYKWGAISLDLENLSTDSGYGIGGGDTESEAKRNAKKFCAEDGAKGCEIVTTYEHCGSVAVTKSGTGGAWGTGDTESEAKKNALTKCGGNKCKIVVTDCN